MQSFHYPQNHWEAISIRQTKTEADNSRCTEPHIGHVLSDRLNLTAQVIE